MSGRARLPSRQRLLSIIPLLMLPFLTMSTERQPAAEQSAPSSVLTADMDNLEGKWLFRTDPEDVGERQGWQRPDWDVSGWRVLVVPGSWESQGITDPRPGMPPKPRMGMPWTDYDGVAWYRRRFVVPRSWAGKRLVLHLGSVDDADRTYVNGVLVGETPITRTQAVLVQRSYKISPGLVKPGEANTIAVRVTDGGGPGGMMGPNVYLVPEEMLTAPVRLADEKRPPEKLFMNPPARSRILKIIHNWPDRPEDQDALIRTLASQGFGGVVCNVSFDQYLRSEEHWRAFVRAVGEAKKAGMSLWLYDEKGYPSGTAGGLTMQGHPDWAARGMLISDAMTNGESVDFAVPPGRILLSAAYPVTNGVLDRQRAVPLTVENGHVHWLPPRPGRWHAMVITEDAIYEGTHAANSLGDKLPYINLLQPEPTARFLELTHDAYARRLGNDLGKCFVSTFTDEPSLMSLYLRPMPYRVLPWSQNLEAEFRRRRGYDLRDILPLLADGQGPAAEKARYDFWRTVSELVSGNFFGQIQQWCSRHHILSGGHLLLEEGLTMHVPLYGDFFRCVRRLDAPSIDCLTSIPSEVPWHIARMIGSVADLEGRTVTMCETSDHVQVWRSEGDTRPIRVVTEGEIRGTCNRLMLGGINTITSYYRFLDLSGAQLRRLNEYVGRCCTMLAGGHQVADIAVLYPVESAWVRFRPSRHMVSEAGAALKVETAFRSASETLFRAQRDFTYVDSKAIVDSTVSKGYLVHGNLRWRVVILPRTDTLPLAAWQKLDAFVRSGGVLIALAALPANSEKDYPSAAVRKVAERVFGRGDGMRQHRSATGGVGVYLPEGTEHMLPYVLRNLLEPDVSVAESAAPLRVTHRRVHGREVYFLINDSDKMWQGLVKVAAMGAGQKWDPLTGRRSVVADSSRVPVALQPYAGVFLTFARVRERQLRKPSADLASQLSFRRLEPTRVSHGAGQFVEGSVHEEHGEPVGGSSQWRVAGRVRKSNVDCHLFLMLQYEPALDLSREAFLRFTVIIPDGQPAAPQLLVIVTDRRGVQYWAETGISLGAPGKSNIVLPLSNFAHAPFSAGPAGPLDWSAITGIAIGWGGYFGNEGERIEFTSIVPAAGKMK